MKLFCLILSVYIVMLSIRPCCINDDCQGKKIDNKELAGKIPLKEKECKGCSPFFTCGTCAGFVMTRPFSLNPKPATEIASATYPDYHPPYIKQVSASIWQPPRLS